MKKFFLLLLFITFITGSKIFAQKNKIDSVLELYGNNYQPEKTYLHFDKYMYNKGETIWVKAYLMQGFDLSTVSKNYYFDFFNNKGELLKHFVAPVFQSTARAQFDIPSNYKGGFIHVKAYTQWMLNFDTSFLFEKNIPIVQNTLAKIPVVQHSTTLTFFPEGGDLVEGLNNNVAFLSVNQSGNPVDINGVVINSKGKIIDSIKTQHDGMGSFNFDVKPNEKYTVKWNDETGKQHTGTLPEAKSNGINMQVESTPDKAILLINRTKNLEEDFKDINIVAHMNQHLVYRSRLKLEASTSGSAEIPVSNLPTGILQITLFNANWIPFAERIVFINNHNHEFITDVHAGLKNFDRKGKNIIELFVSDTVAANLSVSITDADLPYDKNTIITQMLLCNDIKGYIPNPSYYFDSNDDSVNYYLDLVMLTHGWRKFNWEKALHEQQLPQFVKDSDYVQIKGNVLGTAGNIRLPQDQQIFLITQAKDSTKHTFILPVNDGAFVQKNVVFFDTVKVFYKLLGKTDWGSRLAFSFQNGFLSPQKNNLRNLFMQSVMYDSSQIKIMQAFAKRQAELEKLMQTTTLQNVTVEAKIKNPKDILDKKYTSGLFSGGDAYQFDVMNDMRAQSGLTVFDYLRGQVAGLQITQNGPDWSLSWRGGTPELFLNEMKTDIQAISNMSMSDVAYIKVFRPPFFGAMGGGGGGAIAVYTKNGSEPTGENDKGKGMEYALLEGYSRYKEFYSPDYSTPDKTFVPDSRTTLYWNPYILTEPHNRRAQISFYNNDITKKFRVIVQGFNNEGKLTYTEKIIQ